MQTVVIRKYSTFFDPITSTQFDPVLDKAAGVYIGMAQVDDSLVAHFQANPAYTVLTSGQYASLATGGRVGDVFANDQKIRADIAALSADISTAPQSPK
jgi:hypothetical protein